MLLSILELLRILVPFLFNSKKNVRACVRVLLSTRTLVCAGAANGQSHLVDCVGHSLSLTEILALDEPSGQVELASLTLGPARKRRESTST